MPTISDVAREAGVGVGTVSRVLNRNTNVAPDTRRRVQEAIEQLGYRPSPLARGLRTRRRYILEAVVPLFTRQFYVEVLRGIEMGLADTDYGLVTRSVDKQVDRDRAFESSGAHNDADGLLIVSLLPTGELVERLRAARCPVVLVDTEYDGLSGVTVDHEAAATLAVKHLLELGHRRIALIDHREDPFTATYSGGRHAGYRQELAVAGLPVRPEFEIVTEFRPEAGAAAPLTLLALPQPPTAIFVGSDSQAVGVLQGARQRGCRVPEDLSIVGEYSRDTSNALLLDLAKHYSDIELAQYLGLTTVRVPMYEYEMGRRGTELLLAQLDGPQQAPTQERLLVDHGVAYGFPQRWVARWLDPTRRPNELRELAFTARHFVEAFQTDTRAKRPRNISEHLARLILIVGNRPEPDI